MVITIVFTPFHHRRHTHVHFIFTEGNSDSGKNEFILQSLVVPDLRHVGIKTSLSYSEKKEDLNTYDSKKGLRDAISQAYRRYIYFLSRKKFEKKGNDTNSLSPHNADYLHSEMMIKILGSYYLFFSAERSYSNPLLFFQQKQ